MTNQIGPPQPQAMTTEGLMLQSVLLRSKHLSQVAPPLWKVRLQNLFKALGRTFGGRG